MMQDYNTPPPSGEEYNQPRDYAPTRSYPTPQSVYAPAGYTAHYPFDERFRARLEERAGIKRLALISGLCMLGYIAAQFILALAIRDETVWTLYESNYYFKSGLEIIYSVFAVGLPFFIIYLFAKRRNMASLDSFFKPRGALYTASLIVMGFGLCLLASYITNWISYIFNSFGVTLPYDEYETPIEWAAIALLFVKTAVVPALTEEFAVRGFLLQSIRKYGDGFAIVMSSLVFSLLHANAVQIPFAFMAGLVLGYVYCKTNSIWPSVIVHFLNNAFSCAESVLFDALPESRAGFIDMAMTVSIGIAALIAMLLIIMSKNGSLKKTPAYLEPSQKARAFIFQPLFFVMALLYLGITISDVMSENL